MIVTGHDLIVQARSFLGVPFAHQGRGRHGLDCLGLVLVTVGHFNLLPTDLPPHHCYARRPDRTMERTIRRLCAPIAAPCEGAIALIRWPRDSHATHIGFVATSAPGSAAAPTFLHCYSREGRVLEQGYREPWTRLTTGLYAFPGVDYRDLH
jgi:hypothetical protein